MSTPVIDRPRSLAPETSPGREAGSPAVDPERPACAVRPELFLDPLLESEPPASASVRIRRHYAALVATATEVCASCPILDACLYRAVVEYDVAGFVAGTTERQRAAVRARLGIAVPPEDLDNLAGVATGQRQVDHDEVLRLRRAHPEETLDRIARRLGCSLSTVKRHLRQERAQPSASGSSPPVAPPSRAAVRRAVGQTLAKSSGCRRAAA